jgi:hypothetical protein
MRTQAMSIRLVMTRTRVGVILSLQATITKHNTRHPGQRAGRG